MRHGLAVLALLLVGCDAGEDCADELVRITVRVVDEAGAPAQALRTTVTNTRNLSSFGLSTEDSTGTYTVISDRNLAFVQRSGDVLEFEGVNDTLLASAQFTVGRQECHVAKFAGPDVIVADRLP